MAQEESETRRNGNDGVDDTNPSSLLPSLDIPAICVDAEMNIRNFTPTMAKLLGLRPADAGRPFADFSHGFADDELFVDAETVIKKLAPIEKEVRYGVDRWYLRRVVPCRAKDARIEGAVITYIDISARKALEDSLAERLDATEHRFQALAENVPTLFSYVDRDERYVFVNKSYEELFQVASADIVGRTVKDVLGESYEAAHPKVVEALRGNDVSYEAEFEIHGSPHWMRVHYIPDIDEDSAVQGFYTFVTDLTREREALESLEEYNDRLVAVLSTVAEAIVTIDQNGTIDSFNPAAERMFGYTAAEALGRNVSILMPEPYRGEHDGYVQRYLETGESRIIGVGRELTGLRKDGTTFPVEVAVTEIDHQRRFTGIIRDITARKQAEEALKQSQEELRSLSARLLAAEEGERRRLSRELHDDFNQRLAMLAVDLESLPSRGEVGGKIERAHDRVVQISDDLRALAYRLHPTMLDDLGLAAAVRALIDDFSTRRGVAVSFRERHFPPRISPDRAACLYRVVQESLANISKHSESPRVAIRLVGTDRGLRLSIRDFGIGFDVQSVRNHRASLGIVSMEERVRMVGGELEIWSFPRMGTRVRVTIPREETGDLSPRS